MDGDTTEVALEVALVRVAGESGFGQSPPSPRIMGRTGLSWEARRACMLGRGPSPKTRPLRPNISMKTTLSLSLPPSLPLCLSFIFLSLSINIDNDHDGMIIK